MFHPKGPSFWELARQGLSSTTEGYDLLAPKFDYTPFRTPEGILDGIRPVLGQVGTGLDVCCGTGAGVELLLEHTSGEVVGIDLSQGMLEQGRENLHEHPQGHRAHLVRTDALHMPFHDRFDVATCFGAFGHILAEDQPAFVAAIFRALRPGGRFVFVTAHDPGPAHWAWWLAHAYNGVTHLRNRLIDPPFHMYYLNFLLPQVQTLCEDAGFVVRLHRHLYDGRLSRIVVVEALKPEAPSSPSA